MKFDDVLVQIGEFGPYQRRQYFLCCLVGVAVAFQQLLQVFHSGTPDHWCATEQFSPQVEMCKADYLDNHPDQYVECIHRYRNLTIPIVKLDKVANQDQQKYGYSKCTKYSGAVQVDVDVGYVSSSNYTVILNNKTTMDCGDQGWVYDYTIFPRTINSDFNLVCDQESWVRISQSLFFAGVFVGSIVFGTLADWMGRYKTFFITITLLSITSLLNAFVPTLWAYVVVRFLVAMGNMGTFEMAFVIGTELVGPKWRAFAGVFIEFYFAAGYILLAVLAVFVQDWRVLQIIGSAPIFCFLLMIPVIKESARWLITQKKFKEAEALIRHAAKMNKTTDNLSPNFMEEIQKTIEENGGSTNFSPLLLFKKPNMRFKMIILMYNWAVNSLVYYGLSLSTSGLGSNIYVAFFISAAVEVPAYILTLALLYTPMGRRLSTSGFELIGGVACLVTILLPLGAARTAVAMIGKFAISASFALVYLLAAEIAPTPFRSAAVGVCSASARIGGILCPLILLLEKYWLGLPLLIFGSSSIIAGLTVLLLPETTGTKMPESVEEAEEIYGFCYPGSKKQKFLNPTEVYEIEPLEKKI